MMILILALLHVKHFLADFPLQTPYMLGKGKSGLSWIMPLAAHCGVHAGLSLIVICLFAPSAFWLAGLEFVAHFIIDRIKVTYKLPAGPWANEVKGLYLSKYYTAFGLDQLAHQLCYVAMVYFIQGVL